MIRSTRIGRLSLPAQIPPGDGFLLKRERFVGWVECGSSRNTVQIVVGQLPLDHHLEMLAVQGQTGVPGADQAADSQVSNWGSPWCLRLMQLQVCLVYLNASYWKLRGELWRRGTAVYYTTQEAGLVRLRLPNFLQHTALIRLATWGTIAIEFALGTLVWIGELRYIVLLSGVLLHLCIELTLNLQLLGMTMLISLLLFVRPEDLERALALFLQ